MVKPTQFLWSYETDNVGRCRCKRRRAATLAKVKRIEAKAKGIEPRPGHCWTHWMAGPSLDGSSWLTSKIHADRQNDRWVGPTEIEHVSRKVDVLIGEACQQASLNV